MIFNSTASVVGAGIVGWYLMIQDLCEMHKSNETIRVKTSRCLMYLGFVIVHIGLSISVFQEALYGEDFFTTSAFWGNFVKFFGIGTFCLSVIVLMYDSYLKLKNKEVVEFDEYFKFYGEIILLIIGTVISFLAFNDITPKVIKEWFETL